MKFTKQAKIGILVLLAVFIPAMFILSSVDLYIRLLLGFGIGYVLCRGAFGFAGSVNKSFRLGTTRLMRYLMMAFMVGSLLVAIVFLASGSVEGYNLHVHPLNIGLVIGATMFGIGMTFSSCCASGIFTDSVVTPLNSLVVLFFFCFGVFMAYPLEKMPFVADSIISTGTHTGVFLPDLFDNFKIGVLVSLLITVIIATIIIIISYKVEEKLVAGGKQGFAGNEIIEDKEYTVYEKIFERQFTFSTTIVYLSIFTVGILAIFKKGWGVTSEFGIWFGKFLMLFGADPQTLADYTQKSVNSFTKPLLESGASVQNIALLVGAIVAVLLANKFKPNLKITWKQFLLCALAGILMGVGTRMSHGCNAGGLFTPVIQFSLSGWFFLIFMTIGGIVGNKILRRVS